MKGGESIGDAPGGFVTSGRKVTDTTDFVAGNAKGMANREAGGPFHRFYIDIEVFATLFRHGGGSRAAIHAETGNRLQIGKPCRSAP